MDMHTHQPFPVTAKQIVNLVGRVRYINTPRITGLEINDDSKADGGAKDLAFWQTWSLALSSYSAWYISWLLVASGDAAKNPFRNTPLGSVEPSKYSSNEWSEESSQLRLAESFARG
ncbi:hypothetical protein IWZ03DRAFT_356900 [Phyllosticta citriasiana]|uniref:Uncharacterized protein n=1 Tax=Phyllosticta citriasiana TaxID=595635 RepID=A0ABR1L0T2_9PEZI